MELRADKFMKIKVINPNTSASMTEQIGATARSIASRETEIVAVNPDMGPVSIEGFYDEALSVIGVLDEIRKGEAQGTDGYVIACFGDPGLYAARELARGPVIGIAEAAMRTAVLLSSEFSIVTTLARTRIIAQHLVDRYGMNQFCRNIRSIDLPVLSIETDTKAQTAILEECYRAIKVDQVGAIVLGCGGMAHLAVQLTQELNVPVIDGVSAAVKLAEAVISLKLKTSKAGSYAFPIAKPYTGIFHSFSPLENP